MKNLRHLFASIAALTLIFSIISGVTPFTDLNAFAEDDDNEDNDQNSTSTKSHDKRENEEDDGSNSNTNSTDNEVDSEEHENQTSSHATSDNGKDRSTNSNNDEDEHRGGYDAKSGLRVDNDGIEVDMKLDTNMTDGTYRVAFVCDTPAFNKTLDTLFEVEDGKGELEAEVALENGTYGGCQLALVGTTTAIASFESFTVNGHEEDDDNENDRHQERRHDIVSNVNGHEIHKRHIKANPSSPGDYRPGWNYTLMADGTAMNYTNSAHPVNATVDINMAVWKSTHAIILLDITGGTVKVEGHEYDVRIGYALYSTEHGVMRVGALVSDDSGNILKLKLYGNASEDAEFPTQAGKSIDMTFEGDSNQSGNGLEGWALTLEGSVKAD